MKVRAYESRDWDRVCEIHDAARKDELAAANLAAAYLTLADTAENEGFFSYNLRVAETSNRVVGFVAFTDDELAWLYVDPASYRSGVARALISAVLQEVRGPMSAEVLVGNEAALAVYAKAGFQVVGRFEGTMPGNEAFAVSVIELRHPGSAA